MNLVQSNFSTEEMHDADTAPIPRKLTPHTVAYFSLKSVCDIT